LPNEAARNASAKFSSTLTDRSAGAEREDVMAEKGMQRCRELLRGSWLYAPDVVAAVEQLPARS